MADLAFTVPSLDQLGEAETVLADPVGYSRTVQRIACEIVWESSDDPAARAAALTRWRTLR